MLSDFHGKTAVRNSFFQLYPDQLRLTDRTGPFGSSLPGDYQMPRVVVIGGGIRRILPTPRLTTEPVCPSPECLNCSRKTKTLDP